MQSLLNRAARWLGISTSEATTPRRRASPRRASIEALEERRALTTNFVNALYQDVLNRAPDAGGEAYFNNLLATGTTPLQVATMFWTSAEHRGIEVDSYYQAFLHRTADAAGRAVWVNNMVVNNMREEVVMLGFLTSPEYLQVNPPQTGFIDGLYQDLLHRSADPTGVTSWLSVLNSRPGTTPGPLSAVDEAYVTSTQRAVVASSFVNSAERDTVLVDSYYSNYLHRPADSAGEQGWVAQLLAGSYTEATVAETFLSSQEYIDQHPI